MNFGYKHVRLSRNQYVYVDWSGTFINEHVCLFTLKDEYSMWRGMKEKIHYQKFCEKIWSED